jgi:hypothetical protein
VCTDEGNKETRGFAPEGKHKDKEMKKRLGQRKLEIFISIILII